MSSITDDADEKMGAGRKAAEDELDRALDVGGAKMPAGIVAAGLVAAIVGVGVLGWMLYRRRRNATSLSARLREAMPEGIVRLPARARARIRRGT
jgi:uncharacterized iron-regulated membrane protein